MTAMVQQLETAPAEASEPAAGTAPTPSLHPDARTDVPASPASLWASESRVHYSITHTDQRDALAWIDCDCVIHSD